MNQPRTIDQAQAFLRSNQLDRAEKVLAPLLKEDPKNHDLLICFGTLCMRKGNMPLARDLFATACTEHSGSNQAYRYLGLALSKLDDFDGALACYNRSLALKPDDTATLASIGNLLLNKMPQEAEQFYRLALQADPNNTFALYGLASAIWAQVDKRAIDLHRTDEALDALAQANDICPDAENFALIGRIYHTIIRQTAIVHYAKTLDLNPSDVSIRCQMGNALKDLGKIDEAIACFDEAARQGHVVAAHNALITAHYAPGATRTDMLRQTRRHVSRLGWKETKTSFKRVEADRPLKVGYLSGDLKDHPVGFFLVNVLKSHRPDFEIHTLDTDPGKGGCSMQIRRTSTYHDIAALNCQGTYDYIRNLGIDILIDLSGFTPGNRLDVFARRAAPVQATWLGYFGTTGIAAMDYILADRFVVPEGDEAFFSETVLRLPDSYLCFSPPPFPTPIAEQSPLARGQGPVFGSFNYPAKISDRCIRVWAEILKAVGNSRLLLNYKTYSDISVRATMKQRFADHGIDPAHLIFRPGSEREQMLECYNDVDVALDPFPFGGGTTTAETLWMGVPLVTLRGDRWVGRVSESLLNAVGLSDLVAADEDEYIALAVKVMADVDTRTHWRKHLRETAKASPMCDAATFTANLESAYRTMWNARRN